MPHPPCGLADAMAAARESAIAASEARGEGLREVVVAPEEARERPPELEGRVEVLLLAFRDLER